MSLQYSLLTYDLSDNLRQAHKTTTINQRVHMQIYYIKEYAYKRPSQSGPLAKLIAHPCK